MSAASRPLKAWQKWVCWIIGVWLAVGSLWPLFVTSIACWLFAHSYDKLPARSAELLAASLLGRLTGGLALLYLGIRLLRFPSRRAKSSATAAAVVENTDVTAAPVAKAPQRSANKRWSSCNVLQIGPDRRQLWGFTASREAFPSIRNNPFPWPSRCRSNWWPRIGRPCFNPS